MKRIVESIKLLLGSFLLGHDIASVMKLLLYLLGIGSAVLKSTLYCTTVPHTVFMNAVEKKGATANDRPYS